LPVSRTAPPARWAAIPARLTGVQRAQPSLATRSRWAGWSTTAAAPLSPTTPMREPPNQVARPRSCRERARVLSWAMPTTSCAVVVLVERLLARSACRFGSPPRGQVLQMSAGRSRRCLVVIERSLGSVHEAPSPEVPPAVDRKRQPPDRRWLWFVPDQHARSGNAGVDAAECGAPGYLQPAINAQFTAGSGEGGVNLPPCHQPAGPTARPLPGCSDMDGMVGAGDPRFGAPIASHLSNAPLRANAANGVTGYDQATLLGSGLCRPS